MSSVGAVNHLHNLSSSCVLHLLANAAENESAAASHLAAKLRQQNDVFAQRPEVPEDLAVPAWVIKRGNSADVAAGRGKKLGGNSAGAYILTYVLLLHAVELVVMASLTTGHDFDWRVVAILLQLDKTCPGMSLFTNSTTTVHTTFQNYFGVKHPVEYFINVWLAERDAELASGQAPQYSEAFYARVQQYLPNQAPQPAVVVAPPAQVHEAQEAIMDVAGPSDDTAEEGDVSMVGSAPSSDEEDDYAGDEDYMATDDDDSSYSDSDYEP